MTLRYFYMDPDAVAVELTDRIWTALEWHSSAEEMNPVSSEWVIEDPDADLLLYPWRRVYVLDDQAPTDHTVIGMGSISDIHIRRSEVYPRNATCRAWHLTITDLNYAANYRLFDPADSPERPSETDLARVAWWLTTQEAGLFVSADTDKMDTTGGVTLDAIDLTTQAPYDLFRGAMDQSGRNAFVGYDETKGGPDFDVPAAGEIFMWYAGVGSDLWASTLMLSNDPADIDPDNGVYPLAEDDLDLHLDPSRIYWQLHMAYDGGLTSVQDSTIADVYNHRETVIDASDLTTALTAASRGDRMLQQGRTPTVRVQWGYHCLSADVNTLMAGQSFQYRATHLGGLTELGAPDFTTEGGVTLRAMDRSVVEKYQGSYYVSGSGVPMPTPPEPSVCGDGEYPPTPTGTYAPTNAPEADADAVIYYIRFGDAQPFEPDPDYTGNPNFPAYGTGGSPDYLGDCAGNRVRILVVGSGTLEVSTATYSGSPRDITAALQHYDEGLVAPVNDDVQTGETGDTFTFTVDTHDGTECIHWVDITDDGTACGGKFGFAGADWTSTETP